MEEAFSTTVANNSYHFWADLVIEGHKSVNLQYITLGCLDDGTNESSTKSLMFQVLLFLYFL